MWKKLLMSKRVVALIAGAAVMMLREKLGIDEATGWMIVTTVLGYMGVETARPSGGLGLFGGKGAVED